MLHFIQRDLFKLYIISYQEIEKAAAQPQDYTSNFEEKSRDSFKL